MRKKILCAALITAAGMLFAACTQPSDNGSSETSSPVTGETQSETVTEESTSETTTVTTTEATTTTVTTTETTAITTEELPFEDTPENAYQRLLRSFVTPEGDEIAPDDYAGVYSYFGKLFVAITTSQPSEYYTSLLEEYTCVKYTTVKYSFNELTRVCESAQKLFSDSEFTVSSCYVDVPINKAAIEINGDPKKAQNYLKGLPELDFELSMLEIVIAEEETQVS